MTLIYALAMNNLAANPNQLATSMLVMVINNKQYVAITIPTTRRSSVQLELLKLVYCLASASDNFYTEEQIK